VVFVLLLMMQGGRKNEIRKIWYKFCSCKINREAAPLVRA
jgi:hypothetical protein